MNVKVEKTEKNVVQLEIEVDAAKFAEAMQKSYLKNVKKYNIPGFRKGRAPRNIVERYYGEQVFYEEAINIICADTYDAAVEENDIHPVDRPDIDIKQIGSGQNLIYTAKVTVRPEVELGEYKGVEINKTEVNVTDEDVQKELDIVVEKNARIISIDDRAVASGDIAVIDFEGFVDEVAFEGGKGENYSLEIGSGQFIPGFEDQLIGAEIGDTVDVNVAFPEDYIKQDLAGKPALFKVRIKEIKFKELPVVDDEFAKDVSEFDTIDEYKADLKKKLTEKAEHEAEHKLEDDVLAKVVDNSKIDIPRVMIEKQIDRLVYDFERRIQYQGMNLQMYMEYTGMDVDTFRGQFEVKAELDVRNQLVIEKISQVENVDAAQDEIDEEVDKVAASYTGNNTEALEDFKKHLREDDIEYIKRTIIVRKTIKLLVENAKIA